MLIFSVVQGFLHTKIASVVKKTNIIEIFLLIKYKSFYMFNMFPYMSSLREKCPNTEFFLVRFFLYSVRIQENTDQKNSAFGHFFLQWLNTGI